VKKRRGPVAWQPKHSMKWISSVGRIALPLGVALGSTSRAQ
jgi:hypothetical protein